MIVVDIVLKPELYMYCVAQSCHLYIWRIIMVIINCLAIAAPAPPTQFQYYNIWR